MVDFNRQLLQLEEGELNLLVEKGVCASLEGLCLQRQLRKLDEAVRLDAVVEEVKAEAPDDGKGEHPRRGGGALRVLLRELFHFYLFEEHGKVDLVVEAKVLDVLV